jgi:hypothetical protein
VPEDFNGARKNNEQEICPEEELNHTLRSEGEGIWRDYIVAKRFRNIAAEIV